MAELLPVGRDRVLFLDDNAVNADAARSVGFVSEHVRGLAEARRALVAVGLLQDGEGSTAPSGPLSPG